MRTYKTYIYGRNPTYILNHNDSYTVNVRILWYLRSVESRIDTCLRQQKLKMVRIESDMEDDGDDLRMKFSMYVRIMYCGREAA